MCLYTKVVLYLSFSSNVLPTTKLFQLKAVHAKFVVLMKKNHQNLTDIHSTEEDKEFLPSSRS